MIHMAFFWGGRFSFSGERGTGKTGDRRNEEEGEEREPESKGGVRDLKRDETNLRR